MRGGVQCGRPGRYCFGWMLGAKEELGGVVRLLRCGVVRLLRGGGRWQRAPHRQRQDFACLPALAVFRAGRPVAKNAAK